MIKNGGDRAGFLVIALKDKIKGVFNRLYCYYDSLLSHDDDHNLFNNDGICLIPLLQR